MNTIPQPTEPVQAPAVANDAGPGATTAVATRRMLPVDADLNMLMHGQIYLATHPLPPREDRSAQQQWLKGLYRVMAASSPPAHISNEDIVHALAFHTSRDPGEIRASLHVPQLRDACESAMEGLRIFPRVA